MKLLHMADLHLGKTVNGMNFIEDQRHVLAQVLGLMELSLIHISSPCEAGGPADQGIRGPS